MSDLVQIVDAALADAARRSGKHLVCHVGCTQCCTGVFAISQQDAARLRDALDCLAQTDTPRAQRVRTRVAASVARLQSSFPGDPYTGLLAEDDESRTFFDESFANDEVCPVLDPATGACDLYSRPSSFCAGRLARRCAMRTAYLAACELCYTTAAEQEIVACEVDPKIAALEEASNDAFNAEHGVEGETIVAFALR